MTKYTQWFWFLVSILLNGVWFLIDLVNPFDSNDDNWYKRNFGLNDPFMNNEVWPQLQGKKSFHNIKKIAKDWVLIPEDSGVEGKRAIRFLSALLVWSWVLFFTVGW